MKNKYVVVMSFLDEGNIILFFRRSLIFFVIVSLVVVLFCFNLLF